MTGQETFDSIYCFVTYKKETHAVFLRWKQFASFANYRQPTIFALELLRKYPESYFIIDARNGFEDDPEDVKWGFSFLLPQMQKAGCKKIGMIMPEESSIDAEMDMWSKEMGKYFEIVKDISYEAVYKKISES